MTIRRATPSVGGLCRFIAKSYGGTDWRNGARTLFRAQPQEVHFSAFNGIAAETLGKIGYTIGNKHLTAFGLAAGRPTHQKAVPMGETR
jgi:hypothetical protein